VSTDPQVLRRLDALVAIAWKEGDGAWQTTFPDMHREAGAVDPRPLKFEGNKLVVPTQWHPYLKDSAEDGFSPWHWVDSLTGIELVDGDAYFQQFVPNKGDETVKRGLTIFLRNCQYCHSAHDVGATYGGDFLRPFALHTVKTPKDLVDHVTINKMDAMKRGLMMPTQKNIAPEDLGALLKWVEALSQQRNLGTYKPSKGEKAGAKR
jgi:mono/diheme cytochrome c family protein